MISITLALPAFIVGVILLYKGSDILVDGTVKTAAQLGVSALIISVILVGFGTSSPEFAISVGAAYQQNSEISLGNIVGSCIANLFLVLGISALIKPIQIKKKLIKREFPILLGATLLLFILTYFGLLDSNHIVGGLIFLIAFFVFLYFFLCCARKERSISKTYEKNSTCRKSIMFILLGIGGVVVGAWLLIESAVALAHFLGIPAFIVAISIVAIGTSLPELVVSAMAAYKNESDVAIGNVLGSNVFNICLILGIAALFIPLGALATLNHITILLLLTVFMFPILLTGHIISRKEGILLLAIYSTFMWYTFFW